MDETEITMDEHNPLYPIANELKQYFARHAVDLDLTGFTHNIRAEAILEEFHDEISELVAIVTKYVIDKREKYDEMLDRI